MRHLCTPDTDLDELVGHEEADGFHAGPLSVAMRRGEALELIASDALSRLTLVKIAALTQGLLLVETGECIAPAACFKLVLL